MGKTVREILGASVHTETQASQNEDTEKVETEVLGASIHTEQPKHPYLKN
jgi:hypothetical protein